MRSDIEKKSLINVQNRYKKLRKVVKSDNFCNCKAGSAITKWGAIKKSHILVGEPEIISYFWE